MIGLRLYTRWPPACLALSAKRLLHRISTGMRGRGENKEWGQEKRRGWQGVEKVLGEAEQEELGVAKEGGVGCGCCGGGKCTGNVCGGEACETELGGFLSLQMSGH